MIKVLLGAVLCFMFGSSALANTTIFPPRECNSSELKIVSWQDGAASTYCLSGQDILTLAIPSCADGQSVIFRSRARASASSALSHLSNGSFVCEASTPYGTVPTCAEGEFLTYANIEGDTQFICRTPKDGGETQNTAIPNCAEGEALTKLNGNLVCIPLPGVVFKTQTHDKMWAGGSRFSFTCPSNQRVTSCRSILVPSGASTCDMAINGDTCTHAGCTSASAIPGATGWSVRVVCGWVEPGTTVTAEPAKPVAPKLSCTPRYATSATKGACGLTSTVQCLDGEFAMTGGALVSNASGQTSAPTIGADGKANGWTISVLNDGTSACTINDHVKDGTVAKGDKNNLPKFPVGNGAFIYGLAMAVCCHY